MKFITALAVICGTAAVVWGQPGNSGQAPDRETVGAHGNRIHHFLSVPADALYRAEHGNGKGSAGFNCSSPCSTTLPLIYGTGPVMRNPTNYLIFWQPGPQPTGTFTAPAFPAGYQAGIEKFFQNVGGTPFYNIVTQYNDSTGVPVPNATSLGAPSWTDTATVAPSGCDGLSTGTLNKTPDCPLTDADIQNEVTVALKANPTWLPPGNNVEYYVYTPTAVGECDGPDSKVKTSNDCFDIKEGVGTNEVAAYCAYHSYFNGNTIYSYMPFASDSNNCGSEAAYPNGAVLDLVLSPTSHEMLESNTDPLINGWKGAGGNSDEIGDKCSYIYGYIAPDGTNVVLNGNRFQIQIEYSNDFGGCTKRYGPDPVTGIPGAVAFGEVQAGTSAQMGSLIQNNGQGDLNILNVRVGSSAYYNLVNGQPTGATLHSSESLTANVQFAPADGSAFGSPTDSLVVDTDQTPCPLSQTCTTASTTAFANITGTVGVPPSALCQNATVSTDYNLCSTANASVNKGSFDPDNEPITVSQSPAGPYTLGVTNVTLTAIDSSPDHATASCPATVTVIDTQKPNITCPADQTLSCTSSSGAAATVTPTFSDNCPAVTASCAPPSGSVFGFGTTNVTCTATDGSGLQSSCLTHVTVQDVPPTITSVVASPNVLTPPNKKMDPVVISVKDSDPCDPAPVCKITAVTANVPINPSSYNITGPLTLNLQANGNGGHTLTYVVTVTCTDQHGGATTAQTSVSAPAH